MTARNITLTLPDELVRRAKVLAAQRDTSVSALVGSLLNQALGDVERYEQVWAAEEMAMDTSPLRIGEITWTRDEMHTR